MPQQGTSSGAVVTQSVPFVHDLRSGPVSEGNIYVGDRGNARIQVFDPDLNPIRFINNVRAPWAICLTPPNAQGQQFLFSADAGGKI